MSKNEVFNRDIERIEKMIIYLDKIYSDLEWWGARNKIAAESQKAEYLINVMEKFGELSQALRELELENTRKEAELKIIDILCYIAILTINAGADIPARKKETLIDTSKVELNFSSLHHLISDCVNYDRYECNNHFYFNSILKDCAKLCEQYGYDFELVLAETIKAISLRSSIYDENVKKYVKADYENASVKPMIKYFETGDKEHLKLVLEEVYKCQDVEQMSDTELTFCYIAKTLKSLENFCELAESAEIELGYRVKKLENKIKRLEKRLENDI